MLCFSCEPVRKKFFNQIKTENLKAFSHRCATTTTKSYNNKNERTEDEYNPNQRIKSKPKRKQPSTRQQETEEAKQQRLERNRQRTQTTRQQETEDVLPSQTRLIEIGFLVPS